jgi:hypothetical protein
MDSVLTNRSINAANTGHRYMSRITDMGPQNAPGFDVKTSQTDVLLADPNSITFRGMTPKSSKKLIGFSGPNR